MPTAGQRSSRALSQKSMDTAGDRVKDSRRGIEVANAASIVREMGNPSYQ
jgi:hypothetical protein